MRRPWWQRHSSILPRIPKRRRRDRTTDRRKAEAVRASFAAALEKLSQPAAALTTARGEDSKNVRERSMNELDDEIARLEREMEELGSDGESDGGDGSAPLPAANPLTREYISSAAAAQKGKKKPRKTKGAASDAPAAPTISLHCQVCGINVNSEPLMHEHLLGKKHALAVQAELATKEHRYCEVCELCFTSVAQLEDHKKGRKHRDTLARGIRRGR